MNSPSDSADRPADELERIEIRPEMIEAGLGVLYASGRVSGEISGDYHLIREIVECALKRAKRLAPRPQPRR